MCDGIGRYFGRLGGPCVLVTLLTLLAGHAPQASALEAAREAARSRLRPIIMTAISSLFGFLPLVLANGAGARSQASLGTVVFGGLLVATVLSLLVVPVFYVVVKQLVPPPSALPEEPPEAGAIEGTAP
jgi:HAE1 family hydrophobic/amphiphilic exporter-1